MTIGPDIGMHLNKYVPQSFSGVEENFSTKHKYAFLRPTYT